MTHHVSGVIAKEAELRAMAERLGIGAPARLKAGLAFLPVDESFGPGAEDVIGNFEHLSSSLLAWLKAQSSLTTLAYVETEYHGGMGCQGAVVCSNGKIIMPPEHGDGPGGPVSKAIRLLGLKSSLPSVDEFAEAGLDQFRSNDDWRSAAQSV